MAKLTAAIALFLAASAAYAIPNYDELEMCGDGPDDAAIYGCLIDVYDKYDGYMNANYQTLKNVCYRDDGKGFEKLRKAQRAWIAFRDANCVYEGHEFVGGAGANQSQAACLARMTIDRNDDLESYRDACIN